MVGRGVSDTEMGHEEKGRWEWPVVSIGGMDRGEEAVTWSIWTQVTKLGRSGGILPGPEPSILILRHKVPRDHLFTPIFT